MPAAATRPPRRLLGRPEAEALSGRRLPWLMGGMLLWAAAIFLRLVWLQVIEHRHYANRAEGQHLTRVPIMPIRGELRDRKGDSLAISLKVESLFCDPRSFYPNAPAKGEGSDWGKPDRRRAEEVAAKLAPILEMPKALVLEKLLRKKPFVWVERQLPPSKAAAIRALELEGLDFQSENRRFYPRGSLACQILGFTNIDGQGQLGIEQAYDSWLGGRKGEMVAARDAHGKLLALEETYPVVPVNGSSIQLSIDATIQHIVEEVLAEGVARSHPRTAYAAVVDPNTGEILAMAGTPSFDPNQILPKKFRNRAESEMNASERAELRAELERQKAARKVHPVEDAYEPGSTMKVFTAAVALEERKVHLGEKIDCGPGRWEFGPKNIVTDTHKHGVISFEEVLWQSSNIGAAKMGIRLAPADHYQYLRKFGFGDATGLNFPGETTGRLIAPDRWSPSTQVTMSYGYGLSTSPLQVLMAGCAIANGGRLMKPILVERIYNDQGALLKENLPEVRDQAISEETSGIMKDVLKGVVTNGTGKKAKLEGGVEVFGKTGTSRKLIPDPRTGKLYYDEKRHFASFMGFFPAEKPQYGVLIMLDDPQGDLTGGDVAAPLFAEVGNAILRYQQTAGGKGNDADLKLSLRDWPVGETDEATFHIEQGKVPELKGLSLKAAIQRVVMAGGLPAVEGAPSGITETKVVDQSPAPGTALEHGQKVKIRVGSP